MILRVDIRGNGEQLADYVVALKDNDYIEILEVDGREDADRDYLQQTILEMQLNAELTRTDKAFFHTQINPAYGEDRAMTRQDWYMAADILAAETGYEHQRRVIVLHTKKGRTHAHVIWERYNHDTGLMIDNKHSRLKADAARPKIEAALGHRLTPRRNPQRPELKTALTKIWNETATGAEFIREARKSGYIIASGTGNRPFMVVDENGRAFDLVRQITDVRTKEVRARLRHEELVTDKRAIEIMRELQGENSGKREKQQMSLNPATMEAAKSFAENRFDATQENATEIRQRKNIIRFDEFKTGGDEISHHPHPANHEQQRKEELVRKFADNNLTDTPAISDVEPDMQKIIAEQERIKQRNKTRRPRQ